MSAEFDPYKEFLSIIEERTKVSGTPSIGRILGVFLLENKPLDQKDIAEKSGYTIPHVSKNLRMLEELDYVEKTAEITDKTGRPKFLYQLKVSYDDFFIQVLVANLRILKQTENRLFTLYSKLNDQKAVASSDHEDKTVKDRTKALLDHVTRLNSLIDELIKELVESHP